MTTLTDKFTGLETDLVEQNTAVLASLTTLGEALGFLGTTLDIMIANNATNTRLLLAAIAGNNPCMPCPTPPLLIPPVGTIPSAINEDKCKRVQAFLSFMSGVFTVLDVASAVGVGFNSSLITDAFNQVIATLDGTDEPDPISFPEAVQLVGDLVSYIATNLLEGGTLIGVYTPLVFDLRDAMYITSDAAGARAAYNSVIDGSSAGSWVKPVLKDAAYSAAYSYFFDPSSTPNLTGFSGEVCGFPIGTCYEMDAVASHGEPNGVNIYAIGDTFGPFVPVATIGTTDVDQTYTPAINYAGDLTGWTWQVLSGSCQMQYRTAAPASHGTFSYSSIIGVGDGVQSSPVTGTFAWYNGSATFTIRVCYVGT
jgi:hypothetical protein